MSSSLRPGDDPPTCALPHPLSSLISSIPHCTPSPDDFCCKTPKLLLEEWERGRRSHPAELQRAGAKSSSNCSSKLINFPNPRNFARALRSLALPSPRHDGCFSRSLLQAADGISHQERGTQGRPEQLQQFPGLGASLFPPKSWKTSVLSVAGLRHPASCLPAPGGSEHPRC